MRNNPGRTFNRGFTLLEPLLVMVIIGLLAGYVAPRYFAQVSKSEVKVARAQIGALGKALEAYRLNSGRYPTTEQGLRALNAKPPVVAPQGDGPDLLPDPVVGHGQRPSSNNRLSVTRQHRPRDRPGEFVRPHYRPDWKYFVDGSVPKRYSRLGNKFQTTNGENHVNRNKMPILERRSQTCSRWGHDKRRLVA